MEKSVGYYMDEGQLDDASIELIGQLLFWLSIGYDIFLSDTCTECWALRTKSVPICFREYGNDGCSQFAGGVRVD